MSPHPETPAGELYVHRIDELRDEIRQAMAAISGNKLQALEESLWRQELLCTGLKHMVGTVQGTRPGTTLNTRLQASLAALHQVNQSYAELLRQAGASNHLLYALWESYSPHTRERTNPAHTHCSLEA